MKLTRRGKIVKETIIFFLVLLGMAILIFGTGALETYL
ncbi:MAG: hypothetical protein BWY50_01866 [Spirochaetes bacterium ADurb.Bin315]|nr:MAG: hypothetical protein BWY50_01866 [Spirochaetes bacterium ADurb.Bin315]